MLVTQIPPFRQFIDHMYIGVLITLFYITLAPMVIDNGLPGFSVLLLAELFILAPLGFAHLWIVSKGYDDQKLKNLFPFAEKLPKSVFLKWTLLGVFLVLLVYIPHYPLGLFLRQEVFGWLPEWYFNPTYGTDNLKLISQVFLVGIFIDGVIGPTIEELFFRGYLLPRMTYLKNWAPIVNGALFGIYHLWQPHNLIAAMAIGIILSYIVWKKRNVYLGIAVHCSLNTIGAVAGYLATQEGILVGR